MTAYFDVTDQNDLALLPVALRAADDVAVHAAAVEAEIIEHYTAANVPTLRGWYPSPYRSATRTATNSARFVYLRGYTTDAADAACDPELKTALKRTIALVIQWRFAQARHDPLVASESGQQGKTTTYTPQANDPFPPNWSRLLDSFDAREVY